MGAATSPQKSFGSFPLKSHSHLMNVRCLHVPLLACHLRCRQDEEYLVCRIVRIRVAVPEALHYELVALRQLLGHEYFGLAREERRMACEWRRVRCRTVVFSPFGPEPGLESGTAHEYSKELVAISYSNFIKGMWKNLDGWLG
jgi:hypothetical protein